MPPHQGSTEGLDFVVFYSCQVRDLQIAFAQSILQAGGVPILTRGAGYSGEARCELLVPRARIEEANRLLAEAEAAGPRAAEEAERASEGEFRRGGRVQILTPGTYAVRYPRSMAIEPDDSEDFDLVTVFSSNEHDAEMEALSVQSVLDAGGIPAVIVGSSVLPNLPFEVRVPNSRLEEAEALIAASEAAGPAGAEEAERASEEPR
jgi:hypothetical protein